MTTDPAQVAGGADPVAAAWASVDAKGSLDGILAALREVGPDHPRFAEAQHIRAICAVRRNDAPLGRTLIIDAIRRGDRSRRAWMNLAGVAANLRMPPDMTAMLLEHVGSLPAADLPGFTGALLSATGFSGPRPHPRKAAVFEALLLPLLAEFLNREDMDGAIALESAIYESYVKPTETEAHFAQAMGAMEPLFTRAAHRWRDRLPPRPSPPPTRPYRIGFFIHNASMLAHIDVLLSALKGYRALDDQPFVATVYGLGGKSEPMERALAAIGVRLVMLNERFPEARDSHWSLLLRLRDLLAEEGVQQLVWISLVTMLPLAFGLRLAPVQTWFSMKYKTFSQPDIDGYLTLPGLARFGALCGRRWRLLPSGHDDWYDPDAEERAAALRAPLKDFVILATLARTEKMTDPAYLQAVVSLLRLHPEACFIWAGRAENPAIVAAFQAAGVLDRTRFVGWVDTRLYAQVADIFLDSFPFPCGHTLAQAMAAGKPVVIYDSPDSRRAGLWMFVRPVLEDGEGTDEERAELRTFMGEDPEPLIPVARTPEAYVLQASRLIRDEAARRRSGEACRRFIARYYSDPQALGAALSRHLVELIEDREALAG